MQDTTNIVCRKAVLSDMLLYLNWANDHTVRQNAISKENISIETHRQWFTNKLKDTNAQLFVFEEKGKPIGQVRFDIENKNAIIDYSIDSDFRGRGYGKEILKLAIEQLREKKSNSLDKIIGMVKESNIPSGKIFSSLGFEKMKVEEIKEEAYIVYSLKL